MTGRDDAIEAGGRALYEDTWLPELWPAWEALHEKRREEYRHRFAVCLDAALPHLVDEPIGYVVAADSREEIVAAYSDYGLSDARDEARELGGLVLALVPVEDQP